PSRSADDYGAKTVIGGRPALGLVIDLFAALRRLRRWRRSARCRSHFRLIRLRLYERRDVAHPLARVLRPRPHVPATIAAVVIDCAVLARLVEMSRTGALTIRTRTSRHGDRPPRKYAY